MIEVNIDEICEPIRITVGGKTYTVEDIDTGVAKRMEQVGKEAEESGDANAMKMLLAEILGADASDIEKLGVRKIGKTLRKLIGIITEEVEGKNVPEAAVVK